MFCLNGSWNAAPNHVGPRHSMHLRPDASVVSTRRRAPGCLNEPTVTSSQTRRASATISPVTAEMAEEIPMNPIKLDVVRRHTRRELTPDQAKTLVSHPNISVVKAQAAA